MSEQTGYHVTLFEWAKQFTFPNVTIDRNFVSFSFLSALFRIGYVLFVCYSRVPVPRLDRRGFSLVTGYLFCCGCCLYWNVLVLICVGLRCYSSLELQLFFFFLFFFCLIFCQCNRSLILMGFFFSFFLFVETVSRLHCESESFKMDLILDINSWVYPMELGKLFRSLFIFQRIQLVKIR